jgi:hypothetical protein
MSERAASSRLVKAWQANAVDIADCQRTEIVVPLLEHEHPGSMRFDGWPPAVQALIEREVERCSASRAALDLVAITSAVVRDGAKGSACVVLLHHRPRTDTPSPALPKPAGEAAQPTSTPSCASCGG